MPIGNVGKVVMACHCLVEVHSVSAKTKGKAWTRVFVLFPGYHTETPLASIKQQETNIIKIPFDIVAQAYTLLLGKLSQNSCMDDRLISGNSGAHTM